MWHPNEYRGDRKYYPDNKITPTIDLTTEKCIINSTLSKTNINTLVAEIKDFYLNTKMDRFKYMRFKMVIIPHRDNWIEQFNRQRACSMDINRNTNGYVYLTSTRHTGKLKNHKEFRHSLIWTCKIHTRRVAEKFKQIDFALGVYDFLIKYKQNRVRIIYWMH